MVIKFGRWKFSLICRYINEGCMYRAAYLAYLSLISLVPMLVVTGMILAKIKFFKPVTDNLQSAILHVLFVNLGDKSIAQINAWVNQANTLSWVHLLTFVAMALIMMFNINRAFRAIWHTEKALSWSLHCLFFLVVLVLSPMLLGLIFLFSGLVSQWTLLANWLNIHHLKEPLFILLSHGLIFSWLVIMNLVIPLCKVPFRAALLSGLVSAFLLITAKKLFAYLIVSYSSYEVLYGALSVIPVFLIWLYVSWSIILFGALLGHHYTIHYLQKKTV